MIKIVENAEEKRNESLKRFSTKAESTSGTGYTRMLNAKQVSLTAFLKLKMHYVSTTVMKMLQKSGFKNGEN